MSNLRRSTRLTRTPKKLQNEFAESNTDTKKQRRKQRKKSTVSIDYSDDEFIEELENTEQNIAKQEEIFIGNNVDGKNICPIDNSPVKKNAMLEKAKTIRESLPNTNFLTPKVIISGVDIQNASDKLNKKNKNLDFNKENEKIKENLFEKSSSRVTRSRARATVEYNLKPDQYFAIQSEKSVTSNNTLSKLKHRQLDEKKIQELLKDSSHISKSHQERIEMGVQALKMHYIEWVQIMEEGFNVLLYGFGSKRLLINDFYKEMIEDEPTLIVNGFFPSLTIKEILDNIIVELLGLQTVTNQSECFSIIENTLNAHPDDRIYLLINNIDGEMLRAHKAQEMLSRLANIPNLHVLASVDHINAPLIWDNVMRARYNFFWVEATTFLPYQAETSYESSLLIQKSGALALLSLKNVFASLNSNAKSIYIILVKYQLENSGHNYGGMTFKDLFTAAREEFITNSDQALRAQLTEFIDHKLVRTKRNLDGAECLIIPLDNSLLRQFLDQYNETL